MNGLDTSLDQVLVDGMRLAGDAIGIADKELAALGGLTFLKSEGAEVARLLSSISLLRAILDTPVQ